MGKEERAAGRGLAVHFSPCEEFRPGCKRGGVMLEESDPICIFKVMMMMM